MPSTILTDGWTLTLGSGPGPDDLPDDIPATVPGCVHTDLLANALIPDPYVGVNEEAVQWIGERDATYRTTFDFDDQHHERVDLVAEGLDTVCSLALNGSTLGSVENQHRSYRLDIREQVLSGSNELVAEFDAPLRAARETEHRIGRKPLVGDALPYNAQRKMASNFGWDWGPTLTTAGIWKPISVHQWSIARLDRVVPNATIDDQGRGVVDLTIDLERAGRQSANAVDVDLEIELLSPDSQVVAQARQTTSASSVTLSLTVEKPQIWWPRGYGDQPLYALSVRASTAHGSAGAKELDSWSRDVGFRDVEVRVQPDDHGTCFEFHINGQFVWAKGANWITNDCFPARLTREDYECAIDHAVEADMNMLRVWGGGIYEADDFYDICNRTGILVWQDFMFACAGYSEVPEMWDEVEAEAREQISRLAPHPSIVLWSGGNENIEGYYRWGFKDRLAEGEAWGAGYYYDLFPRLLAEIDPTRAYIPSSPFSPHDKTDPQHPDHGVAHSWRVWFTLDYLAYRDAVPRFVAEFGFQGAANYSTLMDAVNDDDPVTPYSPAMLTHQKAGDGNGKLERGWAGHLPDPTSFDDWHFTTQLNQARAIGCAVSHYRSHAPRNAGYVVWQLNDCWPAISWAVVDGDRKRKLLWFTLRALNAPRVLLLQPRGDGVSLIVSNDSADTWSDTVTVTRRHLNGRVLSTREAHVHVAPRSSTTIALGSPLTAPEDARHEVLIATCPSASGQRSGWFYSVEDVDLGLPQAWLDTDVTRTDTGYDVEVTADAFVKDLVFNVDRLDPRATISDQLVTLLPGERHTFTVTCPAELDPDALTAYPVVNSANHLVHAHANTSVSEESA